MAPDFWDDPKKAEKVLASMKAKKTWTDAFKAVETAVDDTVVMQEMNQSGDFTDEEADEQYQSTLKQLEDLEFKNMLSADEDQLNAVLQITAGAGGTESCDWASMLMRMYIMWAQKHGYKVSEQDFQEGEVAGVKL
jgi:peptide chain release factor 2